MWIDISRPIQPGMAVYKNKEEKQPEITPVSRTPEASMNESALFMNLHTGTHMDAPFHQIPSGKTIDQVDPTLFVGPCRVLDLREVADKIMAKDLMPYNIQSGEILLFKTRNSESETFDPKFVYLDATAAQFLKERRVQAVGIDAMSVERDDPTHRVHQILLGAEIGVLEDIRLKDVKEGTYRLVAVPLRLNGVDGSPCRALLWPDRPTHDAEGEQDEK